MLGLVVPIFCTFIFATRVVVCWQKEKERKKNSYNSCKLNFLFFLALSDQEEFAWGKLWQIFSQTGEKSCRLQMFSCLEGSFYFLHRGLSNKWIIHTDKQKKNLLFRSDLSITSLFWTHWRHSPHVDFELQTFYIHPRQTGRVAIAMHSLIGTAGF